ncbi:MAG: hypothetical protein OCD76_19510 [Reichenbachiella sp.]
MKPPRPKGRGGFIQIISFLIFFSCSGNKDDIESNANIRLSNISQFDFNDVTVNTWDQKVEFGNINSGQTTDYNFFQIAYRYAFVELSINGDTYTLQPIDYVGETPLKSGNYTYQIDANDSQDQYEKLSLVLIEE